MKKSIPILAAVALLSGCAVSPWPKYEQAVRCHLDNKGPACNKLYEEAIRIDPKTQGLHASYGVHLLQQGNAPEAQKQFEIEKANYPLYAEKGLLALAGAKSDATAVPAKTEAPAAPAAATAPIADTPAAKPTTATPATKPTTAKNAAPAVGATKK